VQSSTRYLNLPLSSSQRAAADALANTACQSLAAIFPNLTPKQKVVFVAAYKVTVQLLAAGNWLTPAQAATLKMLAGQL
jgi:hypothetical protein